MMINPACLTHSGRELRITKELEMVNAHGTQHPAFSKQQTEPGTKNQFQ